MTPDPKIPLERVAAFVRQHAHDVRNGLNGLDLEGALLLEMVTDEEARAGVQRMRSQVRGLAEQLRALSARFQQLQPHRAPVAVGDLLAILREQHAALAEPPEVRWSGDAGEVEVDVDVMMVADIFRELWANAVAFPASGPSRLCASREGAEVVLALAEPKSAPLDPRGWGEAPFVGTQRGAYGLGLWTARRLAEAGGVCIAREFSAAGELVTRLHLPMARG